MTEFDDPGAEVPEATDVEEVASALRDGEATAADQARAHEPAVVEARTRFERVAAAVAAPVPVDADAREAAIAAALGAAATVGGAGDELAHRRERARSMQRGMRIAGIAAAVLAVVALGGVLVGSSGDDREDAATSALEDRGGDASASAESAGSSGAATGGSAAADSTMAMSLYLGNFTDLDGLLAAADAAATERTAEAPTAAFDDDVGTTLASGSGATAASPAPATSSAPACEVPPAPSGTVVSTTNATLDGQPVVVTVVDGDDGRVVQVVDSSTCAVVYEGPPR